VAINGCIQIPAPLWDALVAAGTVEAKATAALVMTRRSSVQIRPPQPQDIGWLGEMPNHPFVAR
jgi:hypothetical protein